MLWRVALLACACVGTTAVDLSQDWVVETNAEAEARLDAAVAGDILSYALVHGGRIVSEYYRAGRHAPTRTICLLYTSPSPRDVEESRMPSSA